MKAITLCSLLLLLTLWGCKKESTSDSNNTNELPTLSTAPITQVTSTSVQSGGAITSDGGSPIIARGVCWATDLGEPSLSGPHTVDGSGTGTYTSAITGLTPNKLYSVRAYATNANGTTYAYGQSFVSLVQEEIPTLTIPYIGSSASTLVTVHGLVVDSGHAQITTRGICWSTSPNPTINDNIDPQGSSGLYTFQSLLTNLTVQTTYHFRAYATNSAGTGYSNDTTLLVTYHIGEAHGGGRIFYIDPSGLHGLVAATSDASGPARWNNTSNPYANINAYSHSDGFANTIAIYNAIPYPGNAAVECRLYNAGGYADWYLPSINELILLQNQPTVFTNPLPTYYWSSTASSTYNANAWAASGGVASDIQDKTYGYGVRAIRAF